MSVVTDQPPTTQDDATTPAPRRGGLLRAELHRFRSRRFIQALLGLAVIGWAVATVVGLLNFGTPTEADYAAARAEAEALVAEQEGYREQCLADVPDDVPSEQWCGPPATIENFGGVEAFLDTAPFDFASAGTNGALAVAVLSAALAFVVGATWIGAEWSTRSIVALLFWVPRRMTVMGTKIGVLTVAAALFGVLMQAAWLAMAGILRVTVGTDEALPEGFWSALLQTQGRGVLMTVFAALLGFGLTNLVRNTGAAMGIALVYVIIAENAVRILQPHWDPFLLTTNAIGLVQHGGYTLRFWDEQTVDSDGMVQPLEYYVGHLQAGILLTVVTAAIVGIGAWLFAKRDLH